MDNIVVYSREDFLNIKNPGTVRSLEFKIDSKINQKTILKKITKIH